MTQKSWWGYSLWKGHCSHKKKTCYIFLKKILVTIWHYIVTRHSVLNLLNNYRLTLNTQVNGRGKGEYCYIYDPEIRPCSGIKWQRRIIKYSWIFLSPIKQITFGFVWSKYVDYILRALLWTRRDYQREGVYEEGFVWKVFHFLDHDWTSDGGDGSEELFCRVLLSVTLWHVKEVILSFLKSWRSRTCQLSL